MTVPLCYTKGKDFAVFGKSLALHQSPSDSVEEVILNGDVFRTTSQLMDKFTRTFPNATSLTVASSRKMEPFTETSSHVKCGFVAKQGFNAPTIGEPDSERPFVITDDGWYANDAFSRVTSEVFTKKISFSKFSVTQEILARITAFEFEFSGCIFGADVEFSDFSKVSFKDCTFLFSSKQKSEQTTQSSVTFESCNGVEQAIRNRFLGADSITLKGDTVPIIPGFNGIFTLKSPSNRPNLSSPSIAGFSGFAVLVRRFAEPFDFRFEHPHRDSVMMNETDAPDRAAITGYLTNNERYLVFAGIIPMPTMDDINRRNQVKARRTTFEGNQSIHTSGFEKSVDGMYAALFRDVDSSFEPFEFLEVNGLPSEQLRTIKGMTSIEDHLRAVCCRSSKLDSEKLTEWISVLKEEIIIGAGLCLLGMKNRLVNSLVGFFDDIELKITPSEDIQNQVTLAARSSMPAEKLRSILVERGHTHVLIEEWMAHYE